MAGGARDPSRTTLARPVTVSSSRRAQRDIEIGGCRIRYVDTGPATSAPAADGRTIVVIPGHTSRLEGFDDLLDHLDGRRVLVMDFPGSGYSDKPDRDYTLGYYEDTLLEFLDQLGIERAVLAGGSLGGNLVLRLGHRAPERFDLLVAWGPAGAWKAHPNQAAVLRRVAGNRLLRRRLFWPTVRIQSRFWYSRDFAGRQAALDDTFAYYREVMGPGFLAMYFGMAADQIGHSLFDLAGGIRQPTLLLLGEHDNGAGMQAGVARLHELIPDNELEIFAGARHSLETEMPAAVAASIDRFVSCHTA